MKETSPLANRDFILRIKEIMKQDNFLLGIGDISRATGVSQRKLRYWEQRDYIKPAKCSEDGQHRKYTYFTMAKISLIQSYLATGYTLKAAVAKTKAYDQVTVAIHKLVRERLVDINKIEDGYEFDLGPLADQPEIHVHAIIKADQPTQMILKKQN
ncbi:MAG: MerR family transcriptional regulator [Liquorilactobacillus ghanensis]|uniref:MerR family transcriptional regulator n=1 Tax=Liquorilactobacillus ghanensis TaxID=399370 RepID=UPI0039E9BB19